MRTVNKLSIALTAVLLSIMTGCEKSDSYMEGDDIVPSGYLVDIYESEYFANSEELVDYIDSLMALVLGNELANIFGLKIETELARVEFRNYLDVGINPDYSSKLAFELHRFRYRTVNPSGNPIILSGTLVMPNNTDDSRKYEMDHVSLFNEAMFVGKDIMPFRGVAGYFRVMYNSLVVVPDLQGYGITATLPKVDFAYINGCQSIDCEMAALEVVRLRGASLKKGYGTYLMGVSKGAFTTLSAHKYLETEAPAEKLKAVNPIGSVCSGAPSDISAMLDYYLNIGETNNIVALSIVVNSLYYASPDFFAGYKLEDLFSDKYNKSEYALKTYGCTLNELICSMELSYDELLDVCRKSGITSMADIFNSAMFNGDGSVNTSDKLYQTIKKAAECNNPMTGWTPSYCKCIIKHSIGDDVIPYQMAFDSYRKMSLYGRTVPNEKVIFKEGYLMGHILNSMKDELLLFMTKDPLSDCRDENPESF